MPRRDCPPRWCLRWRSVIAAAMLLAGPTALPAQTTKNQLWPELGAYVQLGAGARLFFLLASVQEAGSDRIEESQVGAHLEVGLLPIGRRQRLQESYDEQRLRYLRARIGYRRSFSFESGRELTEQRVILELTPRLLLPGNLLVAFRNRLDLRWLDGDPAWRYRPRLWLERESRIGALTLAPYGAAEVFFDWRFQTWNRARYQLGLAIPATSWLVPEVYYVRQIDDEPHLQYINALGLVATLYF